MRKYRGLPKDSKDFVYGWYVEVDGICFIEYQAEESNNRCTVEIIPESVGQFVTKDKNGKDVFAGDNAIGVVFMEDSPPYQVRGKVEYYKASFCIVSYCTYYQISYCTYYQINDLLEIELTE